MSTVLDQIDLGSMALPEFQRGYVWNRNQVRDLMWSLYRKYPVGGLLIWKTRTDTASVRGDGNLAPGIVDLLLDGQQRITSLYGIIRGRPPEFFEGNTSTFTGLHFHLEDEVFKFYAPLRMRDKPLWIDVTELMQEHGLSKVTQRLNAIPELQPNFGKYLSRLMAIDGIKNVDLHVEEVTGEDKTVDIVVDIFNEVNSGGTKLSKGDLALARICAAWPEARQELKGRIGKWRHAGFHFKMDWLLRNVNTIATGEALFSALKDVDTPDFRDGLVAAERHIDVLLNTISARLGLDHDRVLGGKYAFPVMSRYLHLNGGRFENHSQRDKLLYWYVHCFLWGRYAGSVETVMNQDLAAIEDGQGALDRLVHQLRRTRGSLQIHADDFSGWSLGARFYPLLYLLTRVLSAKDWGSGIELSAQMLGRLNSLHLHHVFPKALLYRQDYPRSDVNALANFAFLTMDTNLKISDRPPHEYFQEIAERQPGALESQWIPMDRDLWRVENYSEFLAARRALLAAAANRFLEELLHGTVPETEQPAGIEQETVLPVTPDIEVGDEDDQILECAQWVVDQGLPEPEVMYELADENTGEQLAVFDLAWPKGLQEGYSDPVALLLDEPSSIEEAARRAGYRFFRTVEELKGYLVSEILDEQGAA
ncbi:MAG: DUF262 domain-containing protein [Actinobacteria bacterium]|nr:DUF262 domain-containing protein [Actinomycetota bacterium]